MNKFSVIVQGLSVLPIRTILNSAKIQHIIQFQIEVQSSLQKTNYKREKLSFAAKGIRKVIRINS